MIDMHHDLLSIMYYSYLKNDYSFLENWISNFHEGNVSGLLANLYFMNREEMKEEMGDVEIDVLEMFRVSTDLFEKYLPNIKVIYSIEGCDYIEDISMLEKLYQYGLRNILLVWNNPNKYGSGPVTDNGLTSLGKEFIIKAIDLGISIDLSHMNKSTFYDSIDVIKEQMELGKNVKVIASHSNCRDVYDHRRNLDDDQLRALKSVNGILGLVGYGPFVNEGNILGGYLEHIKHAVEIMGIDNVGVSSDDMDFCEDLLHGTLDGNMVFNYSEIKFLLYDLLKNDFEYDEINKILYENVYNKLFRED